MSLGFRGDVVDYYHRWRRGYPAAVIDSLVATFGLTTADVVLDIGCGTGQLAVPVAARVRAVVGLDPEPDMLSRARSAAVELGVPNVSWLLGADTDVPALRGLLGDGSVGAVTIGQALHWMDHDTLFRALAPLLRPAGGIAVLTNGAPMWLQDSPWSRALLEFLEEWFGHPITGTYGIEDDRRRRYRESLAAAGFHLGEQTVGYTDAVDLERIVGSVFSALTDDMLPAPDRRDEFTERAGRALAPSAPFVERVDVEILTGRLG
jgi:ubiquinone/menaquinone biosynthesis C-methylase UbiE